MLKDRQLTRDLWLHDWPCVLQRGIDSDVRWLEWTASNVWQPVIDRFGRVYFTSWRYWVSSGCMEARTGDHEHPGTVDVVAANASTGELHRWMGENLRDAAGAPLWGSLIDERNHVHYTAPGIGTRGEAEYLYEPTEGTYVAVDLPEWSSPTVAAAGLGPWVLGAAALYFLGDRK